MTFLTNGNEIQQYEWKKYVDRKDNVESTPKLSTFHESVLVSP